MGRCAAPRDAGVEPSPPGREQGRCAFRLAGVEGQGTNCGADGGNACPPLRASCSNQCLSVQSSSSWTEILCPFFSSSLPPIPLCSQLQSRGNRTGSGVSVGNTSVGSFVHSLNKHPRASRELGVILGTSLSCGKYTSIPCRFSSLNNFSIHRSSLFAPPSLPWLPSSLLSGFPVLTLALLHCIPLPPPHNTQQSATISKPKSAFKTPPPA